MKTSDYQLCEMLRTATGHPHKANPHVEDLVRAYLTSICDMGNLKPPFEPESVFVIYERIPVLADFHSSPNKSLIVNQLSMRREDTGLVVDSLRSSKDALFFVRLLTLPDEAMGWVARMNPRTAHMMLRPVDDEHFLMLANVCAFLPASA